MFSRLLVTISTLAALPLSALPARAQSDDPFARENRAKPKLNAMSQGLARDLELKVAVEPPKAKPGEVVKLIISGKPKAGHHTYPLTKRAPDQRLGELTKITLEESLYLKPLWPWHETAPQFVREKDEVSLEHEKPFQWSRDILIDPETKPGVLAFDVYVRLQVCSKAGCVGPAFYPHLEAKVEVLPGPAATPSKETEARLGAKEPAIAVEQPPAQLAAQTSKDKAATAGGSPTSGNVDRHDFWGLLGAAFFGALFMLMTPCVFPMIPITVNFFLKQSEKEHYNPLAMAGVYSGTIIVVLMMSMFVLGSLVIALANNAWFNLVFGFVLIIFALSLFGMFELELPHFLARFTSAREGQGGMMGAVFMAMTFTITSFTCTGPFLGLMLAPVAGIQPPTIYLVLAALVYSGTFAAPFFFLALFPRLLRSLPKSGGWLNTVKVTMGFLEIGAALKFLSIADYVFFPGDPRFFTFDAVLCGWIALSFACGLYLFGIFRLPHDDVPEHIGAVRVIIATLFVGLGVYMMPALFGGRPSGVVGENIIAFAPPKLKGGSAFGAGNHGEAIAWNQNYQEAWKEAVEKKKLIFIDFTGLNCQNCRFNEENVFTRKDVQDELKKYVLMQLYTDVVPDSKLTKAQAEELAERYAEWRQKLAGTLANPTYVIIEPKGQEPVNESGVLNGKVFDFRAGQIFGNQIPDFLQFLRKPLTSQVAMTGAAK